MKTSRRTEGALTYFVISGLGPDHHDVVKHLYYEDRGGEFVKAFPSDAPHLEKCYRNFERHIGEIILQMAGARAVPWRNALSAFLEKVEGRGIDWWLCGSGALAIRGLDVAPHDLDIITDEVGALEIAETLQEHLFEPVVDTGGWICKLFVKAFLHAEIDIAGAVDPKVDEPEPSDYGPIAAFRLEVVDWRGHRIRVPPLDLQLSVSEGRGLIERAEEIRKAMSRYRSIKP